jgi:hypothetical protein
MKKTIMMAGLLFFAVTVNAQQPKQPPTIEQRLKRTSDIMQKEVQPNAEQNLVIESAYKDFFVSADKLRKDNPPPPPDPKMKASMEKLMKERDEKVKKVLTASQYEKYMEAAKKLQPPPPGQKPANVESAPPPVK